MDNQEFAAFAGMWPQAWPVYRVVLEELFSAYDYENLFEKRRGRVLLAKLVPNKKRNNGADLLLRFSFDNSGITWDIFQAGRTIVHAQPVF
jgi:hypothetical protein